MSDNPTNWQYQTTISTSFGQGRPSGLERDGCCATWPKPCSYHEGYQDALDSFEQVGFVLNSQTTPGAEVILADRWEFGPYRLKVGTEVWVRRG